MVFILPTGIRIQNGRMITTNPKRMDTDDDGLSDGKEISTELQYKDSPVYNSSTGEIIQVAGYYYVMYSDPNQEDTDGDGYIDSFDEYPVSPYEIPCLDKIVEMEKYIDEFWTTDYAYTLACSGYITYNDNSIVAMNIIRSVKYGSDLEEDFFNWYMTSGDNYSVIRYYIDSQDSSIMQYFEDDKNHTFTDPYGNSTDFIHMMATLSGQYNTNFLGSLAIDKELSGWAGDLQSLIENLKIEAEKTGCTDLNQLAYSLIGDNSTNFGIYDLLSDVDAQNMSNVYSSSNNLSYMLKDYYSYFFQNRYSYFVRSYGGIESLEEIINEYTRGDEVIKHHLLRSYASKAANANSNISKYVTYEESKALTYAFIRFIKEHMEI